MKPNKGSGQKSENSKLSHDKKMNKSGVKNTGMNQPNTKQPQKRSVGQDGHMNVDQVDSLDGAQQ